MKVGRLAVTARVVLALGGCGGDEKKGLTPKPPTDATTEAAGGTIELTLPFPAQTANALVGKWSRLESKLVAWFKPDGTFVIDTSGNPEDPGVVGTYELDGELVHFASKRSGRGGLCRGASWVWEVGLDNAGTEELLYVSFVHGGCFVETGALWRFARVG
jgi:hypothetical protein